MFCSTAKFQRMYILVGKFWFKWEKWTFLATNCKFNVDFCLKLSLKSQIWCMFTSFISNSIIWWLVGFFSHCFEEFQFPLFNSFSRQLKLLSFCFCVWPLIPQDSKIRFCKRSNVTKSLFELPKNKDWYKSSKKVWRLRLEGQWLNNVRKSEPLNFSQKWTDGKLETHKKIFDVRWNDCMMRGCLMKPSGVEIVNFQSVQLCKVYCYIFWYEPNKAEKPIGL